MHRRTVLVLAVLLTLSAAGCGGQGQGGSATPSPSPSATTPPSEALQKIRVVGEVVEVGDCVVVRDDNAITWTITGEPAGALVLGDRVQVSGAPDLVAEGCGGPVVVAARVTVLG